MDLDRDPSPWRFLSPLHANDASDCDLVSRTRADELRIVIDMVSASRVSLLYAFSGNGKSSLINAGVVPHFRRLGYAVFKTRPRPPWSNHNPVRAFKDCLLRDMELPLFSQGEILELREARDLAESLEGSAQGIAPVLDRLETKISRFRLSSPAPEDFLVRLQGNLDCPLVKFISEIRDYLGADTQILFVCDQFEELFVHYNNSPELDEFVAQVAEVWADNSLKVHFLFSMREDWVGSMIAFRKVIPDIFVNYYKLTPLGRKRATNVLTAPVERLHLSWETEAVDTVLNDLVLSYSENQTNRFNGIDLTPSPTEDPYIELPALQVVADRFWRTRDQHNPPFTLVHYRSLANGAGAAQGSYMPAEEHGDSTSPAQRVLDSYLLDQLRQIKDDLADPQALNEVRLDLLYLLTDRTRHRRALTETRLLAELRQLRPRDLNMPAVDRDLLQQAIRPLIQMRLVTEHDTPDRQKQYELAHDFAVRSVVREWRKLDQERVAQLALLRRDRERKEKQLEGLVIRENRQLKFLRLAPLPGLSGLVAALAMFIVGMSARAFVPLESGLLIVLLGAITAIAASASQKWSLGSSLVAIAGALTLLLSAVLSPWESFWGQADLIALPSKIEGTISSSSDSDYYFFLVPRETELVANSAGNSTYMVLYSLGVGREMRQLMISRTIEGGESLRFTASPGGYWLKATSFMGTGDYRISLSEVAGSDVDARLVETREAEPNDRVDPPSSLLGISEEMTITLVVVSIVLAFIFYLRSLLELNESLGSSEGIQRLARLMAAEFLDILLVVSMFAVAVATMIWLDVESGAWVVAFLVAVPSIWLLFSAWMMHRWRRTPGSAFCRVLIEAENGSPLPWWRALLRQFIFLVWIAVNVAYLLPFLLITPLFVWKSARRQNFFDTLARATVREMPFRTKITVAGGRRLHAE